MYGLGGHMPKLDLTDRFVATIKTKTVADYFDAKTTGLGLRVSPTGVKAWSVMFTIPGTQKRGRLSLGTYPATSLATARTKAIEARGRVEAGEDPRCSKPKMHDGPMTVGDLVEVYIAKKKGIKTCRELGRRLRADAVPVIGTVKLADLHRRDVHRVLDPILERSAPVASAKAFGDLRAMLRWAVERGYIDHDPMLGMKVKKAKPRERFLDEDEIAALWLAWPTALQADVVLALKLALVTGQRIGEVTGITLDEIDLAKGVWNLPASRTKNGSAHTVPLSDMALDLIAEARRTERGGRLFDLNTQRLANFLAQRRGRLPVQDWSAHDLRRSVCTHLAMLGISPLIIGAVVNHRQVTKGGVTLGVYVQYDYAKEKREALDMWADRLTAIVAGTAPKVMPMRPQGAA
jgi:integrase